MLPLVTSNYGPVSVGQYCLAATTLGQAVALTCDPCRDGEVSTSTVLFCVVPTER